MKTQFKNIEAGQIFIRNGQHWLRGHGLSAICLDNAPKPAPVPLRWGTPGRWTDEWEVVALDAVPADVLAKWDGYNFAEMIES